MRLAGFCALLFIQIVVICGGRVLICDSYAILCFAGSSAAGVFVMIGHTSRRLNQDFQVAFQDEGMIGSDLRR